MLTAIRLLFVLFLLSASLSLVGCGSGGGGSDTPKAPSVDINWDEPVTAGTLPASIQSEHSAVYDPFENRFLIAWGTAEGEFVDETWELRYEDQGKLVWNKILPSSEKGDPAPRAGHSSIFDTVSKRMVFFGGESVDGPVNETWEISFSVLSLHGAWQQLVPSGEAPPARTGHTAVFDEQNNRMIVFGGWDKENTFFDDVRVLEFSEGENGTWTKLSPGAGPSPRAEHTAVLDTVHSRLIVFGGWDGSRRLDDVWELRWADGTEEWQLLDVSSPGPPSRSGHTAVLDATSDAMVLFGGADGGNRFNDVWVLDLSDSSRPAWKEGSVGAGAKPEEREQHTAVAEDNQGFRMFVYGGSDMGSAGQVWQLMWIP